MLLISHIYLTKKWGRVKRGKEVRKEKQNRRGKIFMMRCLAG